MVALKRTATDLRAQRLDALAGDVESAYEALRCMLELTITGDCLFADELRNILNIRHRMQSRRGTSLDPMRDDRLRRRLSRR